MNYATILAVAATAVVLIIGNYLKSAWEASRRQRAEEQKAQAELTAALKAFTDSEVKLTDVIQAFTKSGTDVAQAMAKIDQLPKFMEGFVKVCQAFVIEVSKFRIATDKMSRLILQGQDTKEALQTPTDVDKDKAYRVLERMASGEDAETAAQAVEDEELKKTAYGVADL